MCHVIRGLPAWAEGSPAQPSPGLSSSSPPPSHWCLGRAGVSHASGPPVSVSSPSEPPAQSWRPLALCTGSLSKKHSLWPGHRETHFSSCEYKMKWPLDITGSTRSESPSPTSWSARNCSCISLTSMPLLSSLYLSTERASVFSCSSSLLAALRRTQHCMNTTAARTRLYACLANHPRTLAWSNTAARSATNWGKKNRV